MTQGRESELLKYHLTGFKYCLRECVCFHAAHSGVHEFNLENYSVERLTHIALEQGRRKAA